MNKKINSYEELLKEEEQLKVLLRAQKELVSHDFDQLRHSFKPATTALNFIGKVTTRERNNVLVELGVNKAIDLIFRKLILSRSGWLTKLAVPLLIKNYSSHFISDHTEQLMEKLTSWISNRNGNGKAAPETYNAED